MSRTSWSSAQRATLATTVLAGLLFLPWLGAVGLWDPWETHYAEVAREMIERGDFIHPHWEKSNFFSKPVLTMWLQALGMLAATRWAAVVLGLVLVGFAGALAWLRRGVTLASVLTSGALGTVALIFMVGRPEVSWKLGALTGVQPGALPLATEWGVRLPFAACSMAAVGLLTWALSRTVNARVGFFAGLILATSPLTLLLSRQSVTDPLLVGTTVCGVSCALIALFDAHTPHAARWWYGAWAWFAAATLAKGWLGFLLPMSVFAAYLLFFVARREALKAELAVARRLLARPLSWGLVAGALVGFGAWQSGKATGSVFMAGLGGLGAPEWLALTWGALSVWVTTTVLFRDDGLALPPVCEVLRRARVGRGVVLFLALSLPWYYAMFTFGERDDEGKLFWFRFIVHDHLSRFFAGVYTTTPGGSFTYFIEQGGYAVFPWVLLVPGALAVAARVRVRETTVRDAVAGIAALWVGLGWLVVGDSATKFHHYVFPLLPPLAVLMALFVDELLEQGAERHLLALALGVPLFLLVGKDVWHTPKVLTDLFVFNADRPWPEFLVTRPGLGTVPVQRLLEWCALLTVAGAATLVALGRRRAAVSTFSLGAVVFAVWLSWSHWVDLSPHWTQRDLFWRYETLRREGEPIGAFLMNWRGETFYSRNEVVQIPAQETARALSDFLARSKRVWFLVEHARLPVLRNALGNRRVETVEPSLTNKFVLVSVDSG